MTLFFANFISKHKIYLKQIRKEKRHISELDSAVFGGLGGSAVAVTVTTITSFYKGPIPASFSFIYVLFSFQ